MKTTLRPLNPQAGRALYEHALPGGCRTLRKHRSEFLLVTRRTFLDGKLLPWLRSPGSVDESLATPTAAAQRRARVTIKTTVRKVSRAQAARWLLREAIPPQLRSALAVLD